jgi:catechol 2,3-dioxygenase-like lactoylglutathione lyase family enzyme
VTADDVVAAAAATVEALRAGAGAGWSARAGVLEWDCWETTEHIADDLFAYAVQLGAGGYPDYLPIERFARGPGGEPNTIRSEPAAGPEGLFAVLTASAQLLAAMVRVTPPTVLAHHSFGSADAEASAAMGVLETVVHTHDVAGGLGVPWTPDPGLCSRVIARLLPGIEAGPDPWSTLLWATGRIELPGRPRRTGWGWDNSTPASLPPYRPEPGIATVTLVVPDYDEAIAFYTGALGFSLVEDTRQSSEHRWVVVAPPGGTGAALLLARAEGDAQRARIGDQTGDRVALFLSTRDFAADHARMLAAGVGFLEQPRSEPYGTVAVFTDPYGNRWDLIQPS